LSTTAVRAEPPPQRASLAQSVLAFPSRVVAVFSGPIGFALKIVLLAVANALAVWAGVILAGEEKWIAVAVLAATTLLIDWAYMSKRSLALKFLIPGTLLLLAFQVIPILYTVNVAFTNYSTGHILSKSEAIDGIKANTLAPPENGKSYLMTPARDADGNLVLLLADEDTGQTFVGTKEGLTPIPKSDVQIDDLGIAGAKGYTTIKGTEFAALDREISSYTVPTEGDAAIRPEGLDSATELAPTLRYDAAKDQFVRTSNGVVFSDNGRGSFVAANGEELEPGWKTTVGFLNFDKIVHNPLVRDPFLRVFVWTFAFAFLAVGISFVLGLFMAIVLDRPGMRFQRGYRILLVLPYAIPGFLSLLVWQGLLNDDFGVVNKILHIDVPWLFDSNWAKVSVILVSVWLTFPYFFLVSLGALQSIPAELTEAARVDGGGAWQVFRKVTLPLLFIVVAPLLIASFAFNFNNFGNIYFLTRGGPQSSDQTTAGDTDILISYTYKIAFSSGKGQDYALASAVAMIIFFITAAIAAIGFWRTKQLENVR
jgi:arabinogalactan oligomer / maltooligosaccharide transport system permease protein